MRTLKPIAVALAVLAGSGLSLVACGSPTAEPTAMPEPVVEPTMAEPTAEMVIEPTVEMTDTTSITSTAVMTSPLDGPTWVLVSHGDPMSPTLTVSGTRVTATFAGGRMSGNGGCNTYGGDFTVDGDSLTIGPAVSTMMFCEPAELMEQEQAYLALINTAASFTVSDEALTITTTDGKVLNYTAEAPLALEGPIWNLVNYNNGKEAVVGIAEGTTITATFKAGQVTGHAGCNNYFADYTVDGNKITIGAPGSTRMACDQPVMDQEFAYLAALQTAATWSITDGRLEMRTADDAMALLYTGAVTETTATE